MTKVVKYPNDTPSTVRTPPGTITLTGATANQITQLGTALNALIRTVTDLVNALETWGHVTKVPNS